jgi:ferritin-like metal-binding protein YciE
MEKAKQRVVELLVEAQANEVAQVTLLDAHVRVAEHRPYKQLLQEHLRETRSHADRLQRRLDEIGFRSSLFGLGYDLVQNVMKQGLMIAKGPIDMLRGGTDANEKMLRNAMGQVTLEGREIGAYDAIESIARGFGDNTTAELAAEIRLDEERMVGELRKAIPVLADLVVTATARSSDRPLEEPWRGYDDQTVEEINSQLAEGSTSLLVAVRSYELKNKNRSTIIDATNREEE